MAKVDGELKEWWLGKREEIKSRLSEFKQVRDAGEKRIFEELCFCLLTPQSSAKAADRAMRHMTRTGLLYRGSSEQISKVISGSGVLYANKKTGFAGTSS